MKEELVGALKKLVTFLEKAKPAANVGKTKVEEASKTLMKNWETFAREHPYITFGGGVGIGGVGLLGIQQLTKSGSLEKDAVGLFKTWGALSRSKANVKAYKSIVKNKILGKGPGRVVKTEVPQAAAQKPKLLAAAKSKELPEDWMSQLKAFGKKYPKSVTAGGTALGIGGLHALFGGD